MYHEFSILFCCLHDLTGIHASGNRKMLFLHRRKFMLVARFARERERERHRARECTFVQCTYIFIHMFYFGCASIWYAFIHEIPTDKFIIFYFSSTENCQHFTTADSRLIYPDKYRYETQKRIPSMGTHTICILGDRLNRSN